MERLNELLKALGEKYGENFACNPFELTSYSMNMFINKKRVIISCNNDFFMISVVSAGKELLDELMPILNSVMNNQAPICSYDMLWGNNEEDTMHTVEWRFRAPEKRIKDIINGRAYPKTTRVNNIRLFNGKEISSYEETEERESFTVSTKIFGIYPGKLKEDNGINDISELNLYFAIEALGGVLWKNRQQMVHGSLPFSDLSEEEFAFEYLIYQTTRFGVIIPEPCYGQQVESTPSYKAWYNFYYSHFHAMSDATWEAFIKAYSAGEDVTPYLPQGNWQDALENAPLQP